jgi:hypothetical protein
MTRREARVRLAVCAVGFALLAGVFAVRGVPEGPGLIEVAGIAGLFLGWSALGALRRLWRRDP